MTCSRCHGLMVQEHFLDFDGTIGHMWASGHRCMNCGNVHDPIIEQHRLAKKQEALALPGNDPSYHDLLIDTHGGSMHAA
jgi:hypothetical protein